MEEDLRTIFNEGSSPSLYRINCCCRENGKKKLIRTASRTVNLLLAPSFFSLLVCLSLQGSIRLVFAVCIYGNWRGRGLLLSCRQCGPAATITDPLALLGTVVPGKTVRPVSSPPYLVSKRGAAGNNNDEESRMKGHSKKDGARGGSMNFRPGKKLPPL